MTREQFADELHRRLGYKRLSRAWAKAEIVLGLTAAGAGLFVGCFAISQSVPLLGFAVLGLGLFVLGGYLALAGHRSHLYQSSNERLVLLLEELRHLHSKGSQT